MTVPAKMSSLSADFVLPRQYPQRIALASERASDDRIPAIQAIDARARALLQKIVRSLPKDNPSESVRISNTTFAIAISASQRTVARLKGVLEASGFITRRQVQSRRCGMQVSDIWLTDMARQLLGLDTPAPKASASANVANANCLSQSFSKRPPKEAQPVDNFRPQPQKQPKSPNLPEDLHLLQDCSISPFGICKLMGMASKTGNRLGTIVQVAGKHILNANKPFSYVRKLIFSGKDWSAIEKIAHQKQEQAQQASSHSVQHAKDMVDLQKACEETGFLTGGNDLYAWKWQWEWLRRADIADIIACPEKARWLPIPNLGPAAQALRDGNIFPVTLDDLLNPQS